MRKILVMSLFAALAACADLPNPAPQEFLDERSAVTVAVVDAPWILARERRDVAAYARDYLTLAAAERNEAGRYSLALIAHRWSTVDARVAGLAADTPAVLVLVADGRDLRLKPAPALPREFAGRDGRLWEPGVARYVTFAYPIDRGTLDVLAASQVLYAYFDEAEADGALIPPYQDWRDGRGAIARLLESR
jgi:hypothetical protein